jgi:inosine/xanthosine triphosphatase
MNFMKVIIASTGPVKIAAVKTAFSKVFPNEVISYESIKAPSGVSNQPLSDLETFTGARNRSEYAYSFIPDSDFCVGIEGGVDEHFCELQAYAWVYIKSKNKVGKARTASFFLPEKISILIRQGIELGDADDKVFGLSDSKKKNGAVGILTHNIENRTDLYTDAVILALIPFLNHDLY